MVLNLQKEAICAGIPVFTEIGRAVECLQAALRKRRAPEEPPEMQPVSLSAAVEPIISGGRGPLDEHLSKQLLAACGIPTVREMIAHSAAQAAECAAELGFPVVMKGLLAGNVHKTELDLVRLGIADAKGAQAGFIELAAKMHDSGRVLIQPQIPGRVEFILGLLRDPQFGACVMFGTGGIAAELFDDAVFAVAPLTMRDALGMIDAIHGQKLLNGFRGSRPVDRVALARIIMRLGEIGLALPGINEIDINPLLWDGTAFTAVDATVVVS